jgi:hypothetical protein
MTAQEVELARWLDAHQIPFRYEQLQLIKNNDLAGQHIVEGRKVKKHDVLRGVPDFVFQDGDETYFIEVTERRRPDGRRPHRREADPKRRIRHLARLAHLDCAVIYRGEMELFMAVFEQCLQQTKGQLPQITSTTALHLAVKRWQEVEWSDL